MVRRWLPFVVATLVALGHLTLMALAALRHTHGVFSYPIDDAFIHLAIAKHIAFDGVYGVTRYGFTAASSSIVWPFLLAGLMKVVGNHVTLPFILNVVAAVALLAVCARALQRDAKGLGPLWQTLVLVAIVLLVPLATLTMVGMEHVLHAVLTVAFVLQAARTIGDDSTSSRRPWVLVVLAFVVVSVRYEGLFPVGIVAVLLLIRRRAGLAAAVFAAGAFAPIAFGFWSIAHGGLFLPNSIALKRQHLSFDLGGATDLLAGNVLDRVARDAYLLPLVLGTGLVFAREVRRGTPLSPNGVRGLVAFGATVAHVDLASLGWFYRYEAYLVALDLLVMGLAVAPLLARSFSWTTSPLGAVASIVIAALALSPLSRRAIEAQGSTPLACRNIFQQQVQSARFLATYFPHDPVAINDIGAVAYFGDEPIVDLVGLANTEVAKAKGMSLDTPLVADAMEQFAKDAPVAVIYEGWFPKVPPVWVRLGRLRIDANRACAFDSVSVYATSGDAVPRVLSALRAFEGSLPRAVRREGRFIESPPAAPGAEYRVDSGDWLLVDVKGAPQLSGPAVVGDDGSFYIAKIGEVKARGLDLAQMNDAARTKAHTPVEPIPADAEPTVSILERRGCRVYVAGRVALPYDRYFDCGTSAARALESAGMVDSAAVDPYIWREKVRGSLEKVVFDAEGARSVTLEAGDILYVP